ncbi:hypothetical protein CKO11_03890 [Rhodobacter sp. TJ_12]|nr:hypothetical protein [Rhodobacter sp. TJ_12]
MRKLESCMKMMSRAHLPFASSIFRPFWGGGHAPLGRSFAGVWGPGPAPRLARDVATCPVAARGGAMWRRIGSLLRGECCAEPDL